MLDTALSGFSVVMLAT